MSKKTKEILTRIIFDAALIISVFYLPWWLTLPAAFVGIISFSWFWEAVVLALFIESVFAAGWLPRLSLLMLSVMLIAEGVVYYISRP